MKLEFYKLLIKENFYGQKRNNIKPEEKIQAFAQNQEAPSDKTPNACEETREEEIKPESTSILRLLYKNAFLCIRFVCIFLRVLTVLFCYVSLNYQFF